MYFSYIFRCLSRGLNTFVTESRPINRLGYTVVLLDITILYYKDVSRHCDNVPLQHEENRILDIMDDMALRLRQLEGQPQIDKNDVDDDAPFGY
jgi:hypothetical protein